MRLGACDNLERWDGVGGSRGEDMCIPGHYTWHLPRALPATNNNDKCLCAD